MYFLLIILLLNFKTKNALLIILLGKVYLKY
jgi:hypothetical protein